MRKLVLLLLVIVVLNTVGLAKAATVEERLARLEAMVQAQQKEIQALKADKVKLTRQVNQVKRAVAPVDQKKVDAMVSKAIDSQKVDAGVPQWVQDFKFKGDLRYRNEWDDDQDDPTGNDRNRQRIRTYFGFDAKINDEVDVEFRLATGNDLAEGVSSTNQDLGNGFSRKGIFLDLAYFNYHPDAVDNLNIYAGKMRNLFFRPGGSELIFDSDVTPEGGALTYNKQVASDLNVFTNLGGFMVVEEDDGDADASLWVLQGGVIYDLDDDRNIKAGIGYYDFGNIEGRDVIGFAKGNSVNGSGQYTNDYNIIQVFAEYNFPIYSLPGRIFADYVDNVGVANGNSESTGYQIGAGIGKCKDPGSWQFVYNYRDVEADAVVGNFNDGTFARGETDSKGHILGFGYQIAEDWLFKTTWYNSNRNLSNDKKTNDAVLVDLIFTF